MNLRRATMKYGDLAVFIRHDYAEIWVFRYELTLVVGTLNLWTVAVVSCLHNFLSNTQLIDTGSYTFIAVVRTLALEKFKYALKSWRQILAILRFTSAQLVYYNVLRRFKDWLVVIFFYEYPESS
jgi:hypothetical protein